MFHSQIRIKVDFDIGIRKKERKKKSSICVCVIKLNKLTALWYDTKKINIRKMLVTLVFFLILLHLLSSESVENVIFTYIYIYVSVVGIPLNINI